MNVFEHDDERARCQHCPALADERSFMCADCAAQADEEVQTLRDQLEGAVARAETAEARVEELLAAESKAWREAEEWKERAIESAEALRTLCQAVEGEERSGEMPTALVLSLRQARAVVAASTTGGQ